MHFPKNRVRLCWQIIEQQFIPALVIGSAITPNLRNHTMIKCPRCDGTTIKAQNHYEFYDIYECVHCGYWTYLKSEDCCRNPNYIVVVEHVDHFTSRVFYQCTSCGYVNRAKCLNSKKYSELIEAEFDEHHSSDRKKKKDEEYNSLHRQFKQYQNSKYFKYYEYLKSDEWRAKRDLVLQRDNFTCQNCKLVPADDVHHISYRTIYNEILDDLMSVCRHCHLEIHKSFFWNDEQSH